MLFRSDLRDYDFKKNLEQKTLLLSEAEKLADESDVILAFRRLQELHDKWRETGPVAKEIREEIWNKFKDASATVNKRYQAFFEERKARERENEEKKTAICERIEALDFENLKSVSGWDHMTKQILTAQEDWKKLGFASKKVNNALFARFQEQLDMRTCFHCEIGFELGALGEERNVAVKDVDLLALLGDECDATPKCEAAYQDAAPDSGKHREQCQPCLLC